MKIKIGACLFTILALVTGCAPGPPPPPPLLPGLEWLLVVGLGVLLFIGLRKNSATNKPAKTDYLTEALNALNRQMKELEKKIDALEEKLNQKK